MGAKFSKIGAQTGSFCLPASKAKPMVGVCETATPPMILAMAGSNAPCERTTTCVTRLAGIACRSRDYAATAPIASVAISRFDGKAGHFAWVVARDRFVSAAHSSFATSAASSWQDNCIDYPVPHPGIHHYGREYERFLSSCHLVDGDPFVAGGSR